MFVTTSPDRCHQTPVGAFATVDPAPAGGPWATGLVPEVWGQSVVLALSVGTVFPGLRMEAKPGRIL